MTWRLGIATLVLSVLAGCGGRREDDTPELSFEQRVDTTGLTRGTALVRGLSARRGERGAIVVGGDVDFPDGVRIQVTLFPKGGTSVLARSQAIVRNGGFETAPLMGEGGPLPVGAYRVELLSLFVPSWQSADVLRRLDAGRRLRGPGMTRDRAGAPAFHRAEEVAL